MLGSLVKINLQNLFFANYASKNTNGKKRSPFAVVGFILLFIYLFAVLAFAMGTMFMSLYEPYHALQLDWFYFGFAGIMSFGICFIFSIFATKTQLFEAGDNEFLLSMPIKPLTILTSRVLSLLLMNYLYSAIVMVPALVVYLIMGQLSVMGIVSFVLVFVTLPLFSLALSCLFGWLLALATSKMRNKNIFTMILSLAFLGAYFYFYSHFSTYIRKLAESGETIARAVQKGAFPVYHMGNAIANGNVLSLILFLLVAVLPFVLVLLILSRSFISIATENKGTAKAVYVEKKLKASSSFAALFKKELSHLWSSPIYMLNGALGSVLAIAVPILAVFNRSFINELTSALGSSGISLPILASVVGIFCVSPNLMSAPSVSLEGKTLWICRSLPVESRSILLSKAALHFAVSEPAVLFSSILFAILLKATPLELLVMLIVPTAYVAFTSLLGVAVNLKFPRFDWVSEAQVVKQGASVLVTMLVSMCSVIIPALIYGAALSNVISLSVFICVCGLIYLIAAVILYFYVTGSGAEKFETL